MYQQKNAIAASSDSYDKLQHRQLQQYQLQQQHNNLHTIALTKAISENSNEDIAGGVQDTIYLCNFRVSVDGEWLCLKQLQDIDENKQSSITTTLLNVEDTGRVNVGVASNKPRWTFDKRNKCFSGVSPHGNDDNARETAEIERSNLVNICKLVVKELLEQSLRYGRMLDSDHLPLQHFFIVIEHVLGHGLRPKKGLLGPRKELWDLLQSVEHYCPEAQDITASVRDLPTVRTHIGRARAWLRIALMQKKLSDYLHVLIEHRDGCLYDYYEPQALMMSEEIIVIMGILVGLNVIDCNLCVKEEDLDSQQGVIDFSLYLRSSSRNNSLNDEGSQVLDSTEQGNMIAVLDQKNYIEELNRHLNATVGNLQAKVESLTTTNALMKEDLAIARNTVVALQVENQGLRQNPLAPLVQTFEFSESVSNLSGDKASLEILKAKIAEERKRNVELDKELKLQISLKAESDMAMKLLEKDIHEKQDTIVSLRRQLDDIKQINLEMYRKLQECEDELTQKGEMVSRLQTKASQIGNILQSLEKKYETNLVKQQQHIPCTSNQSSDPESSALQSPGTRRQQNLQKFEALTKKHKHDIGPPIKRLHLKVDIIPPFNVNNIKNVTSKTITNDKLESNFNSTTVSKPVTPTLAISLNSEIQDAKPNCNMKPSVDTSKSDYALSKAD